MMPRGFGDFVVIAVGDILRSLTGCCPSPVEGMACAAKGKPEVC